MRNYHYYCVYLLGDEPIPQPDMSDKDISNVASQVGNLQIEDLPEIEVDSAGDPLLSDMPDSDVDGWD